jgi:copper transport protein
VIVVGRRGLFVAVLVSAFAAVAPEAGAHAQLERSRPADGATMARPPGQIELRFTEDVSPRFRVVQLVDGHGHVVPGTRLSSGGDARELVVHVPRLRRGAYQVSWEVLAEADGHVTGGAFGFGVDARPLAASARTPGAAPPAGEAWWRAVDLILYVVAIGALAVAALLARVGPRAPAAAARAAHRRLLNVAVIATGGGLAMGVVLFARHVDRLRTTVAPSIGPADVLHTRWGALWNARELLLAALLTAVLLLRARAARSRAPGDGARRISLAAVVTGMLVVALAVVRALTGHAAADPHRGLAVTIAAAHILAAGAWIGGVAAFGLALSAARREAGALARACRVPFARAAGLSVAVLAVTGLLAAGRRVVSVDALLTTDYGQTLITKSLLVAAAASFGLGNALLLRRGRRPGLLRLEVAFGLSVLMAAAVLTASPPASGPEFAAPRTPSPADLVSRRGDLLITATARPNRPGPNVVTVTALSTRRPPPAPADRAELRLEPRGRPPQTVRLSAVEPGRFAGGAELDIDGRWRMTATVWRGGERVTAPFRWAVGAPDPARPVTYSARRLAPVLDRVAAFIVLLLVAAGAAVAARRRPRRAGTSSAVSVIEPVVREAS